MRQKIIDVAIPGAYWREDLDCVTGEICETCPLPGGAGAPGTGSGSGVGGSGDCDHSFIQIGDGDASCTFDAAVPPDWWLELLVSRYGEGCPMTPPTGGAPKALCSIAYCAQAAISGGAPSPGDACYSTWQVILAWWASRGPNLTAKHCQGDDLADDPLIPEGSQQLVRLIRLPPGSYIVQTRCVDTEDTCCPDTPGGAGGAP